MLNNVWVEELRPKKLDEIIGNGLVIKILKEYVAKGNIPHLLFSGPPGIGKTTVALALANEIYGEGKSHFVEMNACLSEDTQILTRNGWKGINEIQDIDIILGYDSNKNTLQWEKINKIFKYYYDGELVNIKTKYTDILVTPNHNIPIRAHGSRHIRKVQVDCLPDNFYLPLTGKNYDCIDNKEFTDDELKIFGWLLTDGHIRNDYQKHKYISQSESKYSMELKEIFNKIPDGLRKENVYEQKEPYLPVHSFVLGWELSDNLSSLINHSKVLRIDSVLKFSKRQLEIISDSMMKGDGCYLFNTTYRNTPRLYTPYKETAENFFLLCVLCGFRPKIGFTTQKSGNTLWYVSFTKRSEVKIDKKCISKKQYKGNVWCINCESHFFIAKRNGSIFISGNSDERKLEHVRGKIKDIAIKASDKIIFLDEGEALCLDENTEVIVGSRHHKFMRKMKIKDVPQDYYILIPSLNIETKEIETDHGKCVDSGEQDFFKITLENGKEIIASGNHPFFYLNDNKIIEIKTKELTNDTKILDFQDDLHIKLCEICGIYTTKDRFCSKSCANKGHSNDMSGDGNPRYGKEAWSHGKTKHDDIRIEKQCHYGDSNCSKRPEVKQKQSESLKKFYETNEGRQLANKLGKHLSETRSGKSFKELFPNLTEEQLEERIKQSSSTYRENGIFKDTSYRKYLKGLKEIECNKCHKTLPVGGSSGIYIHHKDGNHENNVKENLEFVCPKCHNMICHNTKERFLEKGWSILRGNQNGRS